ncbi:MAG: protein kinase domain-containing protein [Myxococcales bacterium]
MPCESEQEFRARFAAAVARRGVFIASERPEPVGTRIRLRLELRGPGPAVSGEAVVERHKALGKRRGAYVRFVRLDPESLQFELHDGPGAEAADPAAIERELGPARALPELDLPGTPEADRRGEAAAARGRSPSLDSGEAVTAVESPRALNLALRPAVPLAEARTRVHAYTADELRQARDPDAWAGGLQPFDMLGPHQLLKRLGNGGMAEVFLARSTLGQGVEKLVALKMVLPEFGPDTCFASLFLNEARISATLQHPNLIQVFAFGEAAGRPYLSMEYVHGRSLADLVAAARQEGERLPLGFGVNVAIGLCRALEYVHEKRDLDGRPLQLVHRDVSAGNVLVSDRGELKLVDFGVASATALDDTSGLVVGKRGYMSPEQSRGGTPSPAWDIFSLGVLLHELLTLARPFDSGSVPDPRAPLSRPFVLRLPSQLSPDIPSLLDRAVLWAIDPEPRRRAPSARALRELLEEVRRRLPPCEIGEGVSAYFGEQLEREQRENEELIARSRRLAPPRRVSGTMPLLRPLRAVRRRIVSSRFVVRLARHRRAAALGLGLALGFLGAGGWAAWSYLEREHELVRLLASADEQVRAARLVAPSGDGALDLLLQAKAMRPEDPRVRRRIESLVGLFERLGRSAEARGSLAEAAVHYQGALAADPERAELEQKLRSLERAVQEQAIGRAGKSE